MKKITLGLGALLAAGLFGGMNMAQAARPQDPPMDAAKATAKVPAADKMFAMNAARGGAAEIEAGKLAADKATSDALKQFGQKMVDDHTAAGDKLKPIAESKGITLPEKPNAKDAATIAKLSKLNGAAFDSAYKKFAVASHAEAQTLYAKEAKMGKDAELVQFAKDTLPTVMDHHKMANMLAMKGHTHKMMK